MSSFLDDVERIAARDYEPSDNDIVRARLRTLGVQEYNIKFEFRAKSKSAAQPATTTSNTSGRGF